MAAVASARADSDEPWALAAVWSERPAEAQACPIRISLGVLGRKWALVVLRDIAFRPDSSFVQILNRTQGLTPRVLSLRLRELRNEEIIEKVADPHDERRSHYRLTEKGRDAVPILTALVSFGIRQYASEVFRDARPRRLEDCFPGRAPELMGPLYDFAIGSRRRSRGEKSHVMPLEPGVPRVAGRPT
jgi:DNA-binding HxlR family transcriptional regulator